MPSRWTWERVYRGCARMGLDPDDAPTPEECYRDELEMERRAREAARRPPESPEDEAA